MFSRTRTAILLAFAVSPAALSAQQQPTEPPKEVQALLEEVQQIQQQLQPVQQKALQDETVQQGQERAADAVRAAMIKADPTIEPRLDRLETIMKEAQQAQAAGDQEKIAALTQEAEQIQPQVQQAQAAALEHPDVEPEIAAFQKLLRDKMAELDPEARPLLDRLAQLEEQIQAAVRRQGQ
jgi:uncharacterized phage infection (PIP) family protein YhgE